MLAGNDTENPTPHATEAKRVSDRELVIRRVFNARPRTVFDAMTKPELLRRWWAPKALGVVLFEVESDPRVGGRYRFVFGRPDAPRMAFSGVYTEVIPGERLVYTQLFEPMPDTGDGIITITFEKHPAGTLFVSHELYPSKAVLDGALASGMERGMRETLEQLAVLVRELDAAV